MTLTSMTNIVTALLCFAVLIQSARLMRGLRRMRGTDMGLMVGALDEATAKAQAVLGDLHRLLSGPLARHAADSARAEGLRDELETLIGIADAMAERLSSAPSAPASPAGEAPAAAPAPAFAKIEESAADADASARLRAIMQAWPRRDALAEAA